MHRISVAAVLGLGFLLLDIGPAAAEGESGGEESAETATEAPEEDAQGEGATAAAEGDPAAEAGGEVENPDDEDLEGAEAPEAPDGGVESAVEVLQEPTSDSIDELKARLEAVETQLNPPPSNRPLIPKLRLRFGGRVQSDLRFRVQPKSIGAWYDRRSLETGISRNENLLNLNLEAEIGRWRAFADLDFVIFGRQNDYEGLALLSDRTEIVPYRLEFHSATIEATDLILPGLDLRVGQQRVQWGVGDQFNPTNTLNANDLEDPLLFGEQMGNLMVKVDYTIAGLWTFSGVVVPLFRPALLPRSGELAIAAVDRLPFTDPEFRYQIHSEKALSQELLGFPTTVSRIRVDQPEPSFDNIQFAFRAGGLLFNQDIAFSYYRGRVDIPQPILNNNTLDETPACEDDPEAPFPRTAEIGEDENCIDGRILSEVTLGYPRIHVIGLNLAGEIPGIGIGYRLEIGVTIPDRTTSRTIKPLLSIDPTPPGEYDYDADGVAGGDPPEVVPETPFAKWTLGLDYSFGPHLYLNVQWVHGMVDEFGAGDWLTGGSWKVRQGTVDAPTAIQADDSPSIFNCALADEARRCPTEVLRPSLADYLVVGLDFRFARQAALIRLFSIVELSGYRTDSWDEATQQRVTRFHGPFTEEGFSAILYPEFRFNFGNGLEWHVGALITLGQDFSRFGDPATGGSQIFTRARFSF